MIIGVQVSVWMNCKQIEMLPGEWRGACEVATPITAWVPRCLDGHVNSAKIEFWDLWNQDNITNLWGEDPLSNPVCLECSPLTEPPGVCQKKCRKKQQITTPLSHWMPIPKRLAREWLVASPVKSEDTVFFDKNVETSIAIVPRMLCLLLPGV